jgi:uncharacterized protein
VDKRTRTCLLLVAVISSAALQSQVALQTNTIASEEVARKLIEANGGIETFRGLIDQYKEQLQKLRPDVPTEFWNAFFAATNLNDMIDFAIPIYQKHFTQDEIKRMIAFKESPLGKKMNHEMPEITKELAIAGQRWGEKLGQRIQAELDATNRTTAHSERLGTISEIIAQLQTNNLVTRSEQVGPVSSPTDRPSFRPPTTEEAKYLQAQGVDVSPRNFKFLFFTRRK